ncbi:MAG TPA: UDP-N-acetylmuramate dehydrogenase [Saprospiraceae bacterium]|nr:UDP-N-acetylmuramate dehydrogenase [Saprospiraceae bacterium]HNL40067.1 UDP-N-acetylmuramate dehydrogenase [Saprospiraceae bacterium]
MQRNVDLLPYNTFGLSAIAEHFVRCDSVETLRDAIGSGIRPIAILGGGSNILFTDRQPGLVIRNEIKGIEITESNDNEAIVTANGGETWHDVVIWTLQHGLGGLENLSLIPGTVGAAPVQNIGAYGVELKDVFVQLEAIDLETGQVHIFDKAACAFGYRDSVFKRAAKGKFCITRVSLRLTRRAHRLHISYGDIQRTLKEMGAGETPGIQEVSQAVIRIRSSKLPDPASIGNCGSFFKNPEIEASFFEKIHAGHPEMPHYDTPGGKVKVPAGWLIEQCGWKGKRVGNTGAYEKQALVLVNYGGATGSEVKDLAYTIIDSVEKTFGIRLEPEVNIW